MKNLLLSISLLLVLSACSSSVKQNYANESSASHAEHLVQFEQQVGDRVFFAYDESSLSSAAKEQLNKQAAWLKEHDRFEITVQGHCDERGTPQYNLALGAKRANAVKDYLVHMGVDVARIQTVSYGKEKPAVLGHDQASWDANRRGVVVIH